MTAWEQCSAAECAEPGRLQGMCKKHYNRWFRHGDPTIVYPNRRPASERFWEKVEKTETCWLWTAATYDGYGWFREGGIGTRTIGAHRVAYEFLVGPVPEGLQLDHLCRVRHCVNPAHLEPVTCGENVRRGENRNRLKTHCKYGHEFTPENTSYGTQHNGQWMQRRCRTCNRDRLRRQRAAA